MGAQLSSSGAARELNPGRGFTPREKRAQSAAGSRRSSVASWHSDRQRSTYTGEIGGVFPRPSTAELRGDYHDKFAVRDTRPRVVMSAKTRGTGLGYHFPQNCNPDVTNDERAFRQAFNSLQKKQKQRVPL